MSMHKYTFHNDVLAVGVDFSEDTDVTHLDFSILSLLGLFCEAPPASEAGFGGAIVSELLLS